MPALHSARACRVGGPGRCRSRPGSAPQARPGRSRAAPARPGPGTDPPIPCSGTPGLPAPRGGAAAPRGGRAPGEGEGHKAEDGEAEEGDGVRAVEELQRDVLHLLLVDHAEVQAVVYVVLAQGPAPHARRHLAPSLPSSQRGC